MLGAAQAEGALHLAGTGWGKLVIGLAAAWLVTVLDKVSMSVEWGCGWVARGGMALGWVGGLEEGGEGRWATVKTLLLAVLEFPSDVDDDIS